MCTHSHWWKSSCREGFKCIPGHLSIPGHTWVIWKSVLKGLWPICEYLSISMQCSFQDTTSLLSLIFFPCLFQIKGMMFLKGKLLLTSISNKVMGCTLQSIPYTRTGLQFSSKPTLLNPAFIWLPPQSFFSPLEKARLNELDASMLWSTFCPITDSLSYTMDTRCPRHEHSVPSHRH